MLCIQSCTLCDEHRILVSIDCLFDHLLQWSFGERSFLSCSELIPLPSLSFSHTVKIPPTSRRSLPGCASSDIIVILSNLPPWPLWSPGRLSWECSSTTCWFYSTTTTSVCSILYIEFTSLSRLLISAINTFSSICWNITENILFTAQCWICYILSFGFCPFLFYFIYIEVLPSDVKFFSFHFLHMSVLLLTCELLVITIGLFPFHLTLPFDLYFPFGCTLLSSCVCIFGILYFQHLLFKIASWEVTCLPVCLCLGELYLSNLCEIPIYPLEDFESVSVFASAWKVYTCMKVQCAG